MRDSPHKSMYIKSDEKKPTTFSPSFSVHENYVHYKTNTINSLNCSDS